MEPKTKEILESIREETVKDRITGLSINIVSVIISFLSCFVTALLVCFAYNYMIGSFGFLFELTKADLIPEFLPYSTSLAVCTAITSIRLLFLKGV